MFVPSGSSWSTSTVAPSARSTRGPDDAGRAVGAVDDELQARRGRPGDRSGHRVRPASDVGGRRHRSRRGSASALARPREQQAVELGFDGGLDRLGELRPAGREELHAVVLEGVVRRRDHRAGDALGGGHPGHRRRRAIPSTETSIPSATSPATSASSSRGPDARVSRATTNRVADRAPGRPPARGPGRPPASGRHPPPPEPHPSRISAQQILPPSATAPGERGAMGGRAKGGGAPLGAQTAVQRARSALAVLRSLAGLLEAVLLGLLLARSRVRKPRRLSSGRSSGSSSIRAREMPRRRAPA